MEQPSTEEIELIHYIDDDTVVVCDRKKPSAWIRSTVFSPVGGSEPEDALAKNK